MAFAVLLLATKALGDDNYKDESKISIPKRLSSRLSVSKLSVLQTPLRATKTIPEEALRQYLYTKHSPLAGYSIQILSSPYWSTIIGICTIEEYNCSINPYGTNNFWGIFQNGHLMRFDSIPSGIAYIDNFLAKAEANGRPTIESFRGWYCASECTNWEPTVIKIKEFVESLNPQ